MQKQPILRLVNAAEIAEAEIPQELKRLPNRLREAVDDYQELFRKPGREPGKWIVPSQNLIARTAGVNKSTISLALNRKGLSKIAAVTIIRLARVLGVRVEWLLDLSKDKENQRGPIPPIDWEPLSAERSIG